MQTMMMTIFLAGEETAHLHRRLDFQAVTWGTLRPAFRQLTPRTRFVVVILPTQICHNPDSSQAVAPGGTITGSGLPYRPPESTYNSSTEPQSEPDVVREWRERRDMAITHRDEVSAGRKAETVKAAQQAIDDFYENYNNKRDKQVAQTRREAEEYLKNREDTTSGGTSWERIAKLVDLSGKGQGGGAQGTGKAKFREMLLSLRKDEKAPGATGY